MAEHVLMQRKQAVVLHFSVLESMMVAEQVVNPNRNPRGVILFSGGVEARAVTARAGQTVYHCAAAKLLVAIRARLFPYSPP